VIDEARAAVLALEQLGITVAAEPLAAELARRAAAASGALHSTELALAWACAQGNEAAIRHFEHTYFGQARRALDKMRLSATLADDVLGWMRFELFVQARRPIDRSGSGPLIASYSGRGDLGSWVRAIAVHEALKRARKARREVAPDLLDELPMPEPAFAAMRGAYGAEFTRALADSFRALTPQDRNLLRQYFLDGLTIDVLAGLYQIHRATAARRVAAARTLLVEHVRAALVRELALSEAGVEQVITLSNLDQSLGQLLRATR
jgi:RNA polymerase sigma-70 factor, ECF subfamily